MSNPSHRPQVKRTVEPPTSIHPSPYRDMEILPAAAPEQALVQAFLDEPALDSLARQQAEALAEDLIRAARERGGLRRGGLGMMERLMAAFSLSQDEGRGLMELAEAFLRIPDSATRDALIVDKICGRDWRTPKAHGFIRVAAMALATTAALLNPQARGAWRKAVRHVARPIVRWGVWLSMRVMAQQFVLAPSIAPALAKSHKTPEVLYSFDMLGEAARTQTDAVRYLQSYGEAIEAVSAMATRTDPNNNSGVSIKLSALSCQYKTSKWPHLRTTLYPVLLQLAIQARTANVALTIDAEEAARLELSLALVRDLLHAPELTGWNGLGVVVQAYGLQAGAVIDKLGELAAQTNRKIAVRLVKGAYWDAEIKIAQEKGLSTFPVYTRKAHTDLAYLHHARTLLGMADQLYPQFATHNAATLAAVEVMASALDEQGFEVQRLHGMGAAIHQAHRNRHGRKLRVYAPVGVHDDLLAYLVRRLLENGANASFLHKLSDADTDAAELAQMPYDHVEGQDPAPALRTGENLFAPQRANSQGWNLDNPAVLSALTPANAPLPPRPEDTTLAQADAALNAARSASQHWGAQSGAARASVLDAIADGLEDQAPTLFTLLAQEAGKTIDDAVAELREAVDFCRYYADGARTLANDCRPRGVVVAISPWNFPLAIFTGQVAAALAAGNCVIAKPAEQTPRIAALAVHIMHQAGVPTDVLHLLCGPGETLGAHLTQCGQADMVVFTGSTVTAQRIGEAISHSTQPGAPLLAETGGLNAMIVDASALLERAVDDIVASAFRSAGQRCSALRMLYVQDDIYNPLLAMLIGAAEAQTLGDPVDFTVDIGPVIDAEAKADIDAHVDQARADGRLIWQGNAPHGMFCAPAIIELPAITALQREVFGPVLHIAPYPAGGEDQVIADINARGYGLTFGVHSRIAQRYRACAHASTAGNIYINRNQIGAIVGSQPFGGHGLSGTGPKAGGPLYLGAFTLDHEPRVTSSAQYMPGPDGEENLYRTAPRGRILCFEPDPEKLSALVARIEATGNTVVAASSLPQTLSSISAVAIREDSDLDVRTLRSLIASTPGPLIPLIGDAGATAWLYTETHHCTDLTACGGNTQLLTRPG